MRCEKSDEFCQKEFWDDAVDELHQFYQSIECRSGRNVEGELGKDELLTFLQGAVEHVKKQPDRDDKGKDLRAHFEAIVAARFGVALVDLLFGLIKKREKSLCFGIVAEIFLLFDLLCDLLLLCAQSG